MLSKLRTIYYKNKLLKDIRQYYDVIRPAPYYKDNQIVFAF
jgi:hypothetical protein